MSVRYPWDKWFARKRLRLQRGKDFNCQPWSMMVQIRSAATARNRKVSVKVTDNTLNVTLL